MLNADAMWDLQQKVMDGRIDEAAQELLQTQYGMLPAELAGLKDKADREAMVSMLTGLKHRHADEFYPCKENSDLICQYMLSKNLDPYIESNWEFAYQTMKDLFVGRPVPAVVEEKPAKPAPQPKKAEWEKYTPKEIERMHSEEYYEKILRPQFLAEGKSAPPRNREYDKESAEDFKKRVVLPEFRKTSR